MALRLPPPRLPPLADAGDAPMGTPQHPPHRLSRHHLLRRPETEGRTQEPRRGGPGATQDVRQAGYPAPRAEDPQRHGRRCGHGQRLGEDHLQGGAGREGHHLLLLQRGGEASPGPRPQIPRHGGRLSRQLLRRAQLGRLLRRIVRLHPQRRALPDGAEHLLPHQRRQHGSV